MNTVALGVGISRFGAVKALLDPAWRAGISRFGTIKARQI
jgi:hypothetical protein